MSNPEKAQRLYEQLRFCRGFYEVEADRDGATIVQTWSMAGPVRWVRVSGRRKSAKYQQEE